jgi:4-amino-4-deoxy-L-arabinose transferase-like glycosyltransferase
MLTSGLFKSSVLNSGVFKSTVFKSPWHAAVLLVFVFSLLHLFTMGFVELTNDEAQYALYGYYLDWSYFDHPPLSGWLNATILPFSDSDFALRIWPVLLAALTSFLLYGFSRELFGEESDWVGFTAVALYQASIISQLFALAMLPDTPLIPIALAAVWLLYRALKNNQPHLWIYVGLLFGLAGLAKYTAVTLVFTAIISLIIFKQYKALATRWLWLAIIAATIVITPVLYWNHLHDWISITYQLNHGSPNAVWQIKNVLISQVAQVFTYSPAVYIFGVLTIFSGLKNSTQNKNNLNGKFVLGFALPALILFAWSSGYEKTLPHWTAIGWVALTPLIAHWLLQHWQYKSVRVFSYIGLSYSVIMAIAVHLLLSTSILPFKDNQHPLEDIYGWKMVAERAAQLQQEMQSESKHAVIFVGNWSQFSRLAWYAKPTPVQVTDLRYGQSDIWYGSPTKGMQGVLVVPPKYKNTEASGLQKFERCDLPENISQKLNGKIAATYQLYKCYGYKG